MNISIEKVIFLIKKATKTIKEMKKLIEKVTEIIKKVIFLIKKMKKTIKKMNVFSENGPKTHIFDRIRVELFNTLGAGCDGLIEP
jgi:hypothetical protein